MQHLYQFRVSSVDALTGVTNGDPAWAIEYVQHTTAEDLRPALEKFKPTTWHTAKTEAIDFSKPFRWYDDDCYDDERQTLEEHSVFNSWIEVNLATYPDQLMHELKYLKLSVK